MLPNFIIGGGVASGTSFLSATLMNHPEIYLPKTQRPEPNFFHYSWKFNKGLDFYRKLCFSQVGNQKAVGERSSLLLSSPVAAKRMKACIPNAKIIFCLRNPIERAWANYRFTVLEGLEPLSFDEALEQEERRKSEAKDEWREILPNSYLGRSLYSERIKEFIKLFGAKNILLLKSETLSAQPRETIARVCDFLSVKNSFELDFPPNFSSPTVIDRQVQIELRNYFGQSFSELVESIRTEQDINVLLNREEDRFMVERLKANLEKNKDPMPALSRSKLTTLLKNEIESVGHIVDFSVDDWK